MNTAAKGRLEEAYDAVPYTGSCYAQTHPAHMAMVAKLFGLNPPDFTKARVLELGCAAGGNLAPVALAYPQTQCLGIDFSAAEIDAANKLKIFAGLKNVEFNRQDILQFDMAKHKGSFDYIIAHGVFSWVPPDVALRCLKICGECLKPDGLAFISYNALPGWNTARSVRDIMLRHAARFQKPEDKLRETRAILEFLADNLSKKTAFGMAVEAERNTLRDRDDYYLYHDHLSAENTQHYFRDFMRMAGRHGLGYVGESFVNNMYYDGKPQPVTELLDKMPNVIEREQYLDYITNRRFRMTILCRDTQKPDRNPPGSRLRDFHLQLNKQGREITWPDPLAATLFQELGQERRPLAATELVARALKKSGTRDPAPLWNILFAEGWSLVKRGMLMLYAGPAPAAEKIAARPALSPIARFQIEQGNCEHVTDLRGQQVPTGGIPNLVLRLFDGTRSLQDAAAEAEKLLASKVIFKKDLDASDAKAVKAEAMKLVQDMAQGALKNGLFMP